MINEKLNMKKIGLIVACCLLVIVLMREGAVVASNEPAVLESVETNIRAVPQLWVDAAPTVTNVTDVAVSPMDGDDWVYMVSQKGTIWRVNTITAELDPTPFLDISSQISIGPERGLLSLTFDPNYAINRRAYVNYTDSDGDTVVSRISANGSFSDLIESTEIQLMTLEQPAGNHNGGDMAFGPDGYLYISTGDGGGQGDPNQLAQNLMSPMGKILRVDVADAAGYSVPSSNPFVGSPDALPGIFAYGLRNPWRMNFDSVTGDLYIGDVGQNTWEEINIIPSGIGGLNFGWSCYENIDPFSSECDFPVSGVTHPVYAYDHNEGFSVSGGAVYRGSEVPELYGHYIFGDLYTATLLSLTEDGAGGHVVIPHGRTELHLLTATEDRNGELYLVNHDGQIYKISAVPTFPVFLPMVR